MAEECLIFLTPHADLDEIVGSADHRRQRQQQDFDQWINHLRMLARVFESGEMGQDGRRHDTGPSRFAPRFWMVGLDLSQSLRSRRYASGSEHPPLVIAFLAFGLHITLRQRFRAFALGLTPPSSLPEPRTSAVASSKPTRARRATCHDTSLREVMLSNVCFYTALFTTARDHQGSREAGSPERLIPTAGDSRWVIPGAADRHRCRLKRPWRTQPWLSVRERAR